MPNWCSNYVQFDGTAGQLKQLQRLFEAMAAEEEKQGCGQLPDFIAPKRGYFFSLHCAGDVLYYHTKRRPNSAVMVEIAHRFNVNFIHRYDEPGMLIFGEVEYRNGEITMAQLEDADFDLFEYDRDKGVWKFEGGEYENDDEIKKTLLVRKQYKKMN